MSRTMVDGTASDSAQAHALAQASRLGRLLAVIEMAREALVGERPQPERAARLLSEGLTAQGYPPPTGDASYLAACVDACRQAPRSALRPHALIDALPEPAGEGDLLP